ncbi:hypothetical protein [Lysinibacillus xylanilyticus]|uniref:hypothetical protein n=1 Tax=Lysinibacillus xylanilyticus TaxID=582475 RepID=UPI003D08DD64
MDWRLDAPRKLCSARKRSVSGKCFICAKAKRQQQMFYLRESEASAAKRPVGTEINPRYGQIIKARFSNSLIGKMSFIFYSIN